MSNVGVITEQGDLGLGFDILNNKDQKAYSEGVQRQQQNNQHVVVNEQDKKSN